MEIGERLREIRQTHNLNQEEFGKRIGVTRSAICNYENGTRPISDQIILAVCREYGVSEMWLREGDTPAIVLPHSGQKILSDLIEEFRCTPLEGKILTNYFNLPLDERRTANHIAKKMFLFPDDSTSD